MTKLLIVYDHFYPAYKAGGPIQSLSNLAVVLKDTFEISIITSAFDLNTTTALANMQVNEWSAIILPNCSAPINIYYAGLRQPNVSSFKEQIRRGKPGIVYLNGMFSFRFLTIPLIALKNSPVKIVLCPRGMLQAGALAGKALKKKVYLLLLKISGLLKDVVWHATNEEEGRDIQKLMGKKANIIIAGNIPRKPIEMKRPSTKIQGQLKLVYLSLISEKKNLLQAIEIIANSDKDILLDIYGPVKDNPYWTKCDNIIKANKSKIKYKGDLYPDQVQDTFSKYDASILLTKGENFGHALYESLSVGRPIITSCFTPWNGLEEKKAGWNVDIDNSNAIDSLLQNIIQMGNTEYQAFCEGAHKLATEYYDTNEFESVYAELFKLT